MSMLRGFFIDYLKLQVFLLYTTIRVLIVYLYGLYIAF